MKLTPEQRAALKDADVRLSWFMSMDCIAREEWLEWALSQSHRIGTLCRGGRTVRYAYVNGVYREGSVAHLLSLLHAEVRS